VIRFVLTRLLLLVAGMIVASALIFFALRVLPGDVAQVVAGSNGTPEQVERIREQLGLDRSILAQYADWIGGLLRGDLGASLVTGTPVARELLEKAQVTVPLTLMSLSIALIVSVPLGILSALRRSRPSGAVIGASAQAVAAVPVVWAGMLLVILFSVTLGWLPPQGFPRAGWAEPLSAFRSLLLPAITIGVVEGAVLLRFVRSAVLEATGQDYVRTAAAIGLTRTRALLTHGLPVAALSVVSVLALQVAALLVGAVVVEQLFGLPGIGRMLVADVGNRDLTKVQGEILVLTGVVLVLGALIDIVHRVVDPRHREQR